MMYEWFKRVFGGDTGKREAVGRSEPGVAAAPGAPGEPSAGAAPTVTPALSPTVTPVVMTPAVSSTSSPVATPDPAAVRTPARPLPTTSGVSFEQLDRVNHQYYHWLFDMEGEAELDVSEVESQVLEALRTIISSQQSGTALVRRLPGLIPQLLQSLRSDNFSGAQLSRTISNDVVLVAAVISLANSSIVGTGTTITSVEHAVILIGQEGLRHLITSVAFRPIIDMNSGYFTRTLAPRIWDHSERCATANRALAEEMGIDPFEAFLAGLVQNVGLIVTLRIMDQQGKDERHMGSEMFCAQLLRDARTLSCSIGREWHFPDNVTLAISEQGGMKKGVKISPLGRLLTLTDYLDKVRVLVAQNRAAENDVGLLTGLPANAMLGYRSLEPITDVITEIATNASLVGSQSA
jgi:HD-like signal output (HDOD) protein